MRKDRDAIDYAQLALSAVQAQKLSRIASDISQLRDLEEANQRKAETIARLRHVVFVAERMVENMEEDGGVERYPQGRWVGVQCSLNELGKQGIIPPEKFHDYTDKDRATNLEKRLRQVATKARSLMNEDQWRDAQRCWQYMAEEPDLRSLIAAQSYAEAQTACKSRIAILKQAAETSENALKGFQMPSGVTLLTGAFGSLMFVGGVLLLAACILCFVIATVGYFIMDNKSAEEVATLRRLLLTSVISGPASALFFWVRSFVWFNLVPPRCQELYLERRRLKRELKEAREHHGEFLEEYKLERKHRDLDRVLEAAQGDCTAFLDRMEEGKDRSDDDPILELRRIQESSSAKFGGDGSADRLRALHIERRDFVRRIFSEDYLADSDIQESPVVAKAKAARPIRSSVSGPLRAPKSVAISVALCTMIVVGTVAWMTLRVPYRQGHAKDLVQRARSLISRNSSSQAVPLLEEAAAIDADNPAIWEDLGYAYLEQHKWPEASLAYERLAAIRPDSPTPHVFLGMIRQSKNELPEALSEFQEALALDSENTHALVGLGQTFTLQTNFDDAMESYKRAVSLDLRNTGAWIGIGSIHRQRGFYRQAAEALAKATEIDPKLVLTWVGYGQALELCGDLTNALAAFQKAIALNQDLSGGWAGVGSVECKLNQLDEAIPALKQAVALDPNNAWAWAALGRAFADEGNWSDAAIAFDSFDKSAHASESLKRCNRAYLARKRQQLDQALELCTSVVRSDPHLSDGWLELAEVRLARGEWPEATAAVDRAINLAPEWYEALRLRDQVVQEQAIARATMEAHNGRWSEVESGLIMLGSLTNDIRIISLLETARNESKFKAAMTDAQRFIAEGEWKKADTILNRCLEMQPMDAAATALKESVEKHINAKVQQDQARDVSVVHAQSPSKSEAVSDRVDSHSSTVGNQNSVGVEPSFSRMTDLDYELSRQAEDGQTGELAAFIKSKQIGQTVKDRCTVSKISPDKKTIQFDAKILGVGPFHGRVAYRIEATYTGDGGEFVKSLLQNPRSWRHDRIWEKTRVWVVGRVKDVSANMVRTSDGAGGSQRREENLIILEDARIFRETTIP